MNAHQEKVQPVGTRSPLTGPIWAAHLKELALLVQCPPNRAALSQAQGDSWLILNAALLRYLRIHCAARGSICQEDQEDIAAQKALNLLERIRTEKWDLRLRAPSEIAGYLSTIARNALIDQRKAECLRVDISDDESEEWERERIPNRGPQEGQCPVDPENHLAGRLFAKALRRCAEKLDERARRIWFFRVFLDMSSQQIAGHPEIEIKPNTVDVILMRCRKAIRNCMHTRGFESSDMPAGTFAELWRAFELDRSLGSGEG